MEWNTNLIFENLVSLKLKIKISKFYGCIMKVDNFELIKNSNGKY